jgi:hypothetical protein
MADMDVLKGNTLALEAIAQQLQKSNDLSAAIAARFTKEDEVKAEEENEEAEAVAKAAFTREIVKAVRSSLTKSDKAPTGASAQGMPVDDYNYKHVSSGAAPDADTEEEANIDNSTETTQQPLEAGEKTSYGAGIQKELPGMGEEGAEEYPQIEDAGMPQEEEKVEMAYMKAQLSSMAKAITDLAKSQSSSDSAVAEAVENQMRKIGWKEAEFGGRTQSRILPDAGDKLEKAAEIGAQAQSGEFNPETVVDQLTKMSYADMAEMQVSMAGQGDALTGILNQK